ncbi:hypothetical protein NSTC731_03007 [Nostoc sp. DSM 114167]
MRVLQNSNHQGLITSSQLIQEIDFYSQIGYIPIRFS